jgi:SAM-dependent methyltransferase
MSSLPKDFDEANYLEANIDVAADVRSGIFKSGADHYEKFGQKENRPLRLGAIPVNFGESEYLAANRDVAISVKDGTFKSGLEHYRKFGRQEHRSLSARSPILQRRDMILAGLDLGVMHGMEIGALNSPLVSPNEGNVIFVDFADAATLRDNHKTNPGVNADAIVEVTAVWGERTLQECVGFDTKLDYVLASHVVEHVPDLITWLEEIYTVLKPSGSLRLAVPDRRYTFDYLRRESSIFDAIEARLRRARQPLPKAIMEHFGLYTEVNCQLAWKGALDPANLKPTYSIKTAMEIARSALESGAYIDTHCWVFTPESFATLCLQMADLDLIQFSCDYFFDTPRDNMEFYVSLKPGLNKKEILKSWESMKRELSST